MRPAFYLENKAIPDVDFRHPELGNPGCGGTEYLFVATPFYLAKYGTVCQNPLILANDVSLLPEGLDCVQVADIYEAARQAKKNEVDVFVYRPRRASEEDILDLLVSLSLPAVGWAHITPKARYLRLMARCSSFKALVCVEHEQYDQIQDTPLALARKLTFIVNGFDVSSFLPEDRCVVKDRKLVAYLGALVPKKGFHLLAKVWPRVLKRHPDARLVVIGSGALYDVDAKLGPWGVADFEYERDFIIPYLSGDDGKPHSSVMFMGKVGLEKKDIIRKALIGVPNPTGVTENCPGSALEFQASGTAVVSGAFWGMLDTIDHGKTGLLGRTADDLVENICFFLEHPKQAEAYGCAGVEFVREKYEWKKVVKAWDDLFSCIIDGRDLPYLTFKTNMLRHYKFFIFLNRFFQGTFGRFVFWPSVFEVKVFLSRKLSGLFRFFIRTVKVG